MKTTTELDAQAPSAAERLAATRQEIAALEAERIDNVVMASRAGGDPKLAERRRDIDTRLEELQQYCLDTELLVHVAERKQQLRDLQTCNKRREERNQQLERQKQVIKDAQTAYADAEKALFRLQYQLSDGVYSATLALQKHREAHPEINESELA